MAYVIKYNSKNEPSYEEPCMKCFKQIHYSESEIQHEFLPNYTQKVDYILCPNCGNVMKVDRINRILC